MLVDRDSRCVQESARAITGTRAMGGDSDSNQGGSVWVSFKEFWGQGQEADTGFGGYRRQGGNGFIQSQYVIDQRLLGIRGQNISGH